MVTYAVYRALPVLRGTRAMQMGTGLGVIFLVYVVSKWAGFVTLFNLLSTLLSSIILIVVVVFQNDIRRGLMRVGSRAFFAECRSQETRASSTRCVAAPTSSRGPHGALICSSRSRTSRVRRAQERTLDPRALGALVILFVLLKPHKLHDRTNHHPQLRIAKVGVFFPDARHEDAATRRSVPGHRAALLITEETDALSVSW